MSSEPLPLLPSCLQGRFPTPSPPVDDSHGASRSGAKVSHPSFSSVPFPFQDPRGEGLPCLHTPPHLAAGPRQDENLERQNGKQEPALCNVAHQRSLPGVTQGVGITHIGFPKPGWVSAGFVSPNR